MVLVFYYNKIMKKVCASDELLERLEEGSQEVCSKAAMESKRYNENPSIGS